MEENTSLLKEFERIASLDDKEMGSQLPSDRIPIGYFCPYVPEEMLYAAGAFPLRLMGTSARMAKAQAHLPPHCCHLVKSSLESLLKGELDFLRGVIFSHTCDAMQGLSDIWAFQKRLPLQFNLMMPSNLSSPFARAYLKTEMERLQTFLHTHIGSIPTPNLEGSIRLMNQIREKIRSLYQARRNWPDWISGRHFASIIQAGSRMDRRHFLERLEDLLERAPEQRETLKRPVPIYLTGNMVHSPIHFSIIEEAGGFVVFDDLCSGARFLPLMTREDIDPIEALTERYFSSFLCPAKHSGVNARAERLIHEVMETDAKGVIFLLYKYCEPHYFDYPELKRGLEAKGIPSLLLEVDDPATSQGQMKIRIQAFVEMLSQF